jgi:UDP-glucose 4-epimerase
LLFYQNKCLVLGANGFVGRCLTAQLANIFTEVITLSLDISPDIVGDNITNIVGDFFNEKVLENAIDDCDVVIHLITTMSPVTSNIEPIRDIEQNLIGSVKLLEICKTKQVKKIIFLSSGGTVYGDLSSVERADELHATKPSCSYGIVKLAFENYLDLYKAKYGIEYVVLRVSNPYGPPQRCRNSQGVIASFIEKSLNDERLEIWGDGTAVRDYIYIDDLVNAIIASVQYDGDATIFNIGSGRGDSLNDIINNIQDLTNKKLNIAYNRDSDAGVTRSVLDNSLAIKELNWVPKTTLKEGLNKTITYWRLHKQ